MSNVRAKASAEIGQNDISNRIIQSMSHVPGGTTLSKPVVWIAQMIQYFVALIIITLGKSIKYTIRGSEGDESGSASGYDARHGRQKRPRPSAQQLVAERQKLDEKVVVD